MSVADLMREVDSRVAEHIVERVLEKALSHHTSRSYDWRTCTCSWCDKKREATVSIGCMVSPRDPGFKPFQPRQTMAVHGLDPDDWSDVKRARREHLREWYRAELNKLLEE